ncbi:hypothetical protein [Streptomyces platensis]
MDIAGEGFRFDDHRAWMGLKVPEPTGSGTFSYVPVRVGLHQVP